MAKGPVSVTGMPKVLQLDITHRCNLRCIYCFKKFLPSVLQNDTTDGPGAEMSLELLERVVREIAPHGTILDITGGEPFLNERIWDLIPLCVDSGVRFEIVTKHCFSEAEAARLKDAGLEGITVSLDSPVSEKADRLVGKAGFFIEMTSGIGFLRKHGIAVKVKAVVCDYTADDVGDLLTLLKDLGASKVMLQEFSHSSFSLANRKHDGEVLRNNALLSLGDQNRSSIKSLVKSTSFGGMEVIDHLNPDGMPTKPSPCPVLLGRMFLRPDGRVLFCGQIQELVVGDARDNSIFEIWNSEEMGTLMNPEKKLFEGTDCTACDKFQKCSSLGRCPGYALLRYKRLFAPDENRLCRYFGRKAAADGG